jgi:hypothetical protein
VKRKRDVLHDLKEHVRMTALAHTWAIEALEQEEAGRPRKAEDAKKKARYWIEKCLRIEKHYAPKR